MQQLNALGYTHDQIFAMLTDRRREVGFRFALTDKSGMYLGDITASGSIDYNSQSEIMGFGRFTIKEINEINYIDERIKPYMRLRTPKGWAEYPLGVYLIVSPDRRNDGRVTSRDIDVYDRAIILKEDKFEKRYTIAAGTTYTHAVANILASAGITNYEITESGAAIEAALDFTIGTPKLTAINELLTAVNYVPIHFDSLGQAVSYPYREAAERDIECEYATDASSIVYPGATESLDAYNCPNVVTRYLTTPERDTISATYVNDQPNSLLSTVSRGRRIVDVEEVYDIADEATLQQYVRRIAQEKMIYQTVKFDTALMPHHEYQDCLMLRNDDLNVTGKYIELSWSMDLRTGGKMTHKCRKAVSL